MAIEKDENGLVFAPYDEIVVDMKLPDRRAAYKNKIGEMVSNVEDTTK